MRNIEKTIAEGGNIITKNARYDLTVADVINIAERYQLPRCDELLNVIVDCYKMGVAVGMRNGLKKGAAK